MVQLSNRLINDAKVIHMNRASLTLKLETGEYLFVTRRVFNTIRENPDIPMYQVEREYLGQKTSWVAIPMTL